MSNPVEPVVWTVCPNGIDPGSAGGPKLKFAVHVSPRLTGDGATLAAYTDFIHWATRMQAVGFTLSLDTGAVQTAPATITSVTPSTAAWDAFFTSSTKVNDRATAP